MTSRLRALLLIAAAVLAVVLGVAAWMTSMTPDGVQADYTAVVDADHAVTVATTDQEKYTKSLDALSARTTFVSRHEPSGWQITGDNELVAPPSRTHTTVGLSVGAAVLALGTAAGALISRRRAPDKGTATAS